jgi:hypothetical protein
MDYYFVGDEGSLTSYGDAVDFDWSPEALREFRLWLRTEYTTLDSLNNEWRSNFNDWDSVVPYTTDEARKSRNFAPWADHRTFMEITFARAYQIARDAVLEGDRDAHIAVSGTQATNAYDGADWARLDQVIDDFLSYDGGNQWDMHRSFAKPDAMIGFWTGYGSAGVGVQNAIWTAAIHNVLHPNIFWMYSFLDPDMTYSRSAHDMGTAFKSLKFEGVGKLLMESRRQGDGIAIHYSMSSVHGATMLGFHQRNGDDNDENTKDTSLSFPANRDGWVRTIKDLGLQFDFLSSDQVQRGELTTANYKVLILPMSVALSSSELKNIESFVQSGGVVIADAGTGLMDQHCAWRQTNEVNELFGIISPASQDRSFKASSGQVVANPASGKWGLNPNELTGIVPAEASISGASLLKIGETHAAIAKQTGKGWAIYLNVFFDKYPKLRSQNFGGESYRTLIAQLLEHVGVRPTVRVLNAAGHQLPQAQIARYSFGDAEILTIVKDNVALAGIVGQDGVTTYNDASLGQIAKQEITVKLPKKYFVTDVRSGQKLGFTDTVRSSVIVGDAVILSLTNSASDVKLTGSANAARGDHVQFRVTSSPGSHLIRCHVFGPDGTMLSEYARNLLTDKNGATTFVLPSALNDKAGPYVVRATDIVSGATSEFKVVLK